MRNKKQRFEVIRWVHGIYQYVLRTPHDSKPACDGIVRDTIDFDTGTICTFGGVLDVATALRCGASAF
jgi:hypothetical protein